MDFRSVGAESPFSFIQYTHLFSIMKKLALILILGGISFLHTLAQDDFHSSLRSTLQSEYAVTGGNWLFFNNEADILTNTTQYGGAHSVLPAANQNFETKARMVIATPKTNPWDAGWNLRNKIVIQQGDVLLLTFSIRSVGARGKVNFFAENATTFEKEVILTMPIDTAWQQYFIPVESQNPYNIERLVVGFHLGFQAQTIEIGGFTALNYSRTVAKSALPEQINNQFYEGWEPDAPWRAEAAQNIDNLRKANLTLQTRNLNGMPFPDARVEVNMLQHEFAFGSAVTADKIAGNNNQNVIYENKIINLDGKGHGFNWVVFENDMKWPAWENNWFVSNQELANAVTWLKSNGIKIRGHTLVWPGFDNMPNDIQANQGDIDYIKNRINTHLETILNYPGIAGNIEEWDVLNETVTNRSLEDVFRGKPGYPTGREIFAEIFTKAHELDTNMGLYINDYITISQQQEAGAIQYENLKDNVTELVAADVGMTGIGFQGHIGGFPNGIPSVLATLDDFYDSFGLTAKITEFDMPTFVSGSTASAYLVDFMTAIFGHPSVDGFMFWNFWDGSTWRAEGTNLFNLDWSITEPGEAYIDAVFNKWWTQEELFTDSEGNGTVRGFKGMYEVSYTCGGEIVKDTLSLSEDMIYTINCDQLTTDLEEELAARVKVYPNPSEGIFQIELPRAQEVEVQVYGLDGKLLYQHGGFFTEHKMDLSHHASGLYLLHISGKNLHLNKKIHCR